MAVIVTDEGFARAAEADVPALADYAGGPAVTIGPADDAGALAPHLASLSLIVVRFPAFGDGRGFTHARRLRAMGYSGTLRAAGHVIADQYAMARRSGFDAVEIPDDLAARQPWPQWQARAATWAQHDYQRRLRAG